MIFLNRDEVEYMLKMLELTPALKQLLEENLDAGGNIDEYQADILRDLCNDRLDICGYDASYNFNEDGKMLEVLVDKLYTG